MGDASPVPPPAFNAHALHVSADRLYLIVEHHFIYTRVHPNPPPPPNTSARASVGSCTHIISVAAAVDSPLRSAVSACLLRGGVARNLPGPASRAHQTANVCQPSAPAAERATRRAARLGEVRRDAVTVVESNRRR